MRALMLLGPTASGKTAMALQIAGSCPVEIISVDSALVYRGMDIGSAKPSPQEMTLCPHHLIDIREISDPYTAADFRRDAQQLIGEILSRGRVPLIVGGTMLYAKALREGIDEIPSADPAVREAVNYEGREVGWPQMHARLMQIDPVTAQRLSANDSQRIGRALEVFVQTGRPLSSFHSDVKCIDESIGVVGLLPADRPLLHARIADRFDKMLEQGFLDEMRSLMARGDFSSDLPAMRSVGYRQAISYLQGHCSREQFIADAKTATRQLAKRQVTWLRSMPMARLFDVTTDGLSGARFAIDEFLNQIQTRN